MMASPGLGVVRHREVFKTLQIFDMLVAVKTPIKAQFYDFDDGIWVN